MIEYERTSELRASAEQVWAHATSMAGVNAELGPWLRMSVPRGLDLRPRWIEPPGELLFHSWLLLAGLLPFDRHALHLEAMDPNAMWFHERSSSLLQRVWIHHRHVEAHESGCRVMDRLRVTPRLPLAGAPTRRLVRAIFDHRHQVLRKRFGRTQ